MTEPDTTTQEAEVDDSSEQILSTETNSMHAQVKREPIKVYFPIIYTVQPVLMLWLNNIYTYIVWTSYLKTALVSKLISTEQLTGLPCLLQDGESRSQTVVQLGKNLLVQ